MNIHTGDIIFYKGTGLISQAIRYLTNSPVSHVAVVVSPEVDDDDDWLLIAEAQWGGFVFSKVHKQWTLDNCALGRVKPTLNASQRKKFRSECLKLLGKKYDYRAILALLRYLVFNTPQSDEDGRQVICSEAVELLYREMGVLLKGGPADYVTPNDIYVSKKVKLYKDFQ